MQSYEMMCIFDPRVNNEDETTGMLKAILGEAGAVGIASDDLGVKRLAYQIRKRGEGHYFLFRFSLDRQAVAGVRRELGIKEALLRYLLVKREA